MKIYTEKTQIQKAIKLFKDKNLSIGYVPTMGALHEGHLSLVEEAFKGNDVVVVSIFVNPTQFDNKKDLKKYPRTLEADTRLLESLDKDILLYAPTVEDIYDNKTVAEHFSFDGLEFEMEGKFRTGHFDGVGTIVKKLFEIVLPDEAYFGKKDFQQLQIIKKLVEKYHIPVKVIGCEIFREANGLAMSSRNARLKEAYKMESPFIYETLKTAKIKFGTESASKVTTWVEKEFAKHELLKLQYFIIAAEDTLKPVKIKSKNNTYRAFIAVYADEIRLIDNIALN
ncbi:pantoate--beta-alanine ligase [Bizionia arctica]|uniref:Pantothenate synthetase n=1 Tax=Bizionia arctica TaxID=1495645 RepID=A0A917GCL1_9FLAO|nr:pantoate--beta-alanine ligase [Bizionia arctica]GGG38342.1 pantothenate synthetase [Bizionia arctica]